MVRSEAFVTPGGQSKHGIKDSNVSIKPYSDQKKGKKGGKPPVQLVRAPDQKGWKRHCDPALWQSVLDIESQFEAILDERLDRGLE